MTTSALELCRETGISYRQLDYWTRRGVLSPIARPEDATSGTPRPFDELEVRVVHVLAALRALGASLDVLREVAAQLRSYGEPDWHGQLFVDQVGLIRRDRCALCWCLDLDVVLA